MSIKTDRLISRAKKLTKKGEIKQAKEIYLNVIKSFPNNQDAKKGISLLEKAKDISPTKAQIDEVMRLYSLGQINEALTSVENLIKIYPNESLLFNICGACCNVIGLDKSAIEYFLKAIELKPDYAEANNNLGITLL